MKKKIIFSTHAIEQNKRRKIPKRYIIQTITLPDNMQASFRGRQLHQKQYDDKILEVVIIHEGDSIIVVTQYWLTKDII